MFKQTMPDKLYMPHVEDVENMPVQTPKQSMLSQRMKAWRAHNEKAETARHDLFEKYKNGKLFQK